MQTVSAHRVTDLAYEDVLPAFQLTLKNLQLDYLDLYLFHWSTRLAKTAQLGNLKEEDKLEYQPEFFSRAWEVSQDRGWMWILPVCRVSYIGSNSPGFLALVPGAGRPYSLSRK